MLYAISMIIFYFSIYVLWPLSQIFKVIKYLRLIAVMNLVYITVFTLHIFNFWRGSKSANVGPYLLVDLDRGSKSMGFKSTGTPACVRLSTCNTSSLSTTSKWSIGRDYTCCVMCHCISSPTVYRSDFAKCVEYYLCNLEKNVKVNKLR
jgi:hypothetical protein